MANNGQQFNYIVFGLTCIFMTMLKNDSGMCNQTVLFQKTHNESKFNKLINVIQFINLETELYLITIAFILFKYNYK